MARFKTLHLLQQFHPSIFAQWPLRMLKHRAFLPVLSQKFAKTMQISTLTTQTLSRVAHVSFHRIDCIESRRLCFSGASPALILDTALPSPQNPPDDSEHQTQYPIVCDIANLQKSDSKSDHSIKQRRTSASSSSKSEALHNKKRTFSLKECAIHACAVVRLTILFLHMPAQIYLRC